MGQAVTLLDRLPCSFVMAKTRTSRRERRLENPKLSANGEAVVTEMPEWHLSETKRTPSKLATNTVDLTTEYYYVYTEVRNILIVTALMLVVLFGLSQFI